MKKIKSNPLKTLLTICIGFLIVYLITKNDWFILISIIIGVLGLLSKDISSFIEKIWFKIAEILSYIIPNIILTLIFYFFLFPVAIMQKIFGKSKNIRLNKNLDSTFVTKNQKFNKQSLLNPW
tara:strand:+ start:346 stop:714 length:369 start_codon:yes stop_codon:yes gene_type:complete